MLNLEPLAARAAAQMVARDPAAALNLINKALLVVAEQGLYAFGLFLATRRREQEIPAAEDIHEGIVGLLRHAELTDLDALPMPAFYRGLTTTGAQESELAALQRILLTKQLVETALTYGRYHARAGQAG